MLPGLTDMEFGRLRMSIGYRTHKRNRPLSPIEVANLLRAARQAGAGLKNCARALRLHETNVRRFLGLLKIPESVQHLVAWGKGRGTISFSVAVELSKMSGSEQTVMARAAIENSLDSKETRQIGQLRRRSDRPLDDCIKEVIGMRPIVERHHVFMGGTGADSVAVHLRKLSQKARDEMLNLAIAKFGFVDITGHLGDRLFTLVGGADLDELVSQIGSEIIESRIQEYLAEGVEHAIKQY